MRIPLPPRWGLLILAALLVLPEVDAKPKWLRVTTPEATIFTNLRRENAVARAAEFSQYVATLRQFASGGGNPMPLTMVVFDGEFAFDAYRPRNADGSAKEVAGYFFQGSSWAVVGSADMRDDSARETIFHEGVHWYFKNPGKWMPAWMEEGVAEVFSTFKVSDKEAHWGNPRTNSLRYLHQHDLIPVQQLMNTGRGELFGKDQHGTYKFYAEAWLFVHYLTFGVHQVPRDAVKTYLQLLETTSNPEAAFKAAFLCTPKEMDVNLSRYLAGGRYRASRTPLASVATPEVTEALPQDLDEACGRLALASRRYELAARHARAMTSRQPDDARGHALLGATLKAQENPAQALAEFDEAARLGSKDFDVYFELGLHKQQPDGDRFASLAPDDARTAADRYEQAIGLLATVEVCYSNLAGVIGIAEPLRDEDRQTLERGARYYPSNLSIQIGLAQIRYRQGDTAGAHAALEAVLNHTPPPTSSVLAYAKSTIDAWESNELLEKLRLLADAEKYNEAIAAIDLRLQETITSALQFQLTTLRRELVVQSLAANVQAALGRSDLVGAQAAIDKILASDAPPSLKDRARKLLAEIKRSTNAAGRN